jgi:hypothetical protein
MSVWIHKICYRLADPYLELGSIPARLRMFVWFGSVLPVVTEGSPAKYRWLLKAYPACWQVRGIDLAAVDHIVPARIPSALLYI